MSKEHTPTPWLAGCDGYVIRVRPGTTNEVIAEVNTIANAEFIVRAVNSHDALLEAAKGAASYLAALPQYPDRGVDVPKIRFELNRAIALAEGKVRP